MSAESTGIPDEGGNDGVAAAALLAAGLGVALLGFFTTLAEANTGFHDWADWWDRVGPLSGKSSLGIISWLASWPLFHVALYRRDNVLPAAIAVSALLFLAGMVLMFPPIFQRIAEI
ncbi:MAG TPA: hypothetical protein VFT91_06435 [Dehalococcoidia bacterium]|nr:hypothetical protein [Dehalococcoidia bacterium]